MRRKSYGLNTRTLGGGDESQIPVTGLARCWYNGNKSIMKMAVVLVAVIASVADIGHTQTFHKTKMLNDKGKEVSVELCFDAESQRLTLKPQKSTVTDVPYGAIDRLSYKQAAYHRAKDGAGAVDIIGCLDTPAVYLTCPASFGVVAVLMLTKGKNHWFYVDYKQGGATMKLSLQLGKSEYEQVLKTATEQTGKPVEVLVSQKGKSPGKKKPTQ
jgi:hypothetical protein